MRTVHCRRYNKELEGLDQAEHGGMAAYADFRMNQH